MTVYLIILGDIMVGSAPLYGGLLASWFGLDAGSTWYLSRPFVVSISDSLCRLQLETESIYSICVECIHLWQPSWPASCCVCL